MRIEHGAPVVAELRGESVFWERLHLAVASKTIGFGSHYARERPLGDYHFPPLEWRALCGLHGYLYAYGRWIGDQEIPFCAVCLERCNRELDGEAHDWGTKPRDRADEGARVRASIVHTRRRHEALLATLIA